ncbi:MAG: hypothetical protein ABSD73_09300 [Candidatus Bathyarchaeia archaeon]|jgi:hypothetical protein
MNSHFDTQSLLEKAKEQEKTYEWFKAAKCYEQLLRSRIEDASFVGNLWEKIGDCYESASRQAETVEEFARLRQSAVEAYRSSAKALESEGTLENQGKRAQRNAIAELVSSWLAPTSAEKRTTLDECLKLGKESLEKYKKSADEASYGKMCNDLLRCFFERLSIASDWRELKDLTQEAITYGLDAINVLSKLADKEDLLGAFSTASLLNWYAANFSEQDERTRKELVQRSISYSEKALELSKQVENPSLVAMANCAAAHSTIIFTENAEDSFRYAEEMLKQGAEIRDNYLKGVAYYLLALVTDWRTVREGDPDKKKEGHRKIIEFSEHAISCLQLVCQDFYVAQTYLYYAESYSASGSDVDASSEERRRILGKAVQAGRKGLEYAKRSGSPDALGSTLHALSKAIHFYSNLEVDKDEKKKLLEEALVYRYDVERLVEKAYPSNDWLTGVNKNYEGLIKVDMVKVEADNEKKKVLLENAAADIEDSVTHCKRWIFSRPVPTNIAAVATYEDSLGGILNELFALTKNEKSMQKAVEVYEDAAKQYKKVKLPSRAAESYWKMAINQDRLGQHIKAAEHFGNAFAEYKETAQMIPHFADFCLDYAAYMDAWSEIEKAKSTHDHENYDDASKHYEKVATVLEHSRRWGHLSSNFKAWSLLEKAEDLSGKENYTESIEAFNKSAELFKEAKEAFEEETSKIENLDEREKAIELCKASLERKDYCIARINIEEARMADRNGDHAESATRYDSAATVLEGILEKETDEKEIRQIAFMCRAWQKMKIADSRISPELYREASELFLKAKEQSVKDRTAMLASGNGAYCKALEHGTTFETTRERSDFLRAKQYLENAANCYLKAGFDSASSWTSGTEMLFDASNYMTEAETEANPNEKSKEYSLAEKCLERSANLFEKAGYVGRRDEVLKTLTRLREKREFALSLGELLVTPTEPSTTRIMSPPGMTVEEPVGLVKFSRAFVQANLVIHPKELVVGETLDLEIQLANLGKETAFLMDIEQLIPEGFDLVEKPEKCVVNDSGLNLKRRGLAPLETAEIKMILKPKRKGKFTFAPKIKYMDETGEHKFCELEQAPVTVKELGIRGWLKGEV